MGLLTFLPYLHLETEMYVGVLVAFFTKPKTCQDPLVTSMKDSGVIARKCYSIQINTWN